MNVWIAKNSNETLSFHLEFPKKHEIKNINNDINVCFVSSRQFYFDDDFCDEYPFPEITCENSPQEFELVKAKPAFDRFSIIADAKKRDKSIRYGQSIYNLTMNSYPKLIYHHFNDDCFYDDNFIDRFLDEAESVWNKLK